MTSILGFFGRLTSGTITTLQCAHRLAQIPTSPVMRCVSRRRRAGGLEEYTTPELQEASTALAVSRAAANVLQRRLPGRPSLWVGSPTSTPPRSAEGCQATEGGADGKSREIFSNQTGGGDCYLAAKAAESDLTKLQSTWGLTPIVGKEKIIYFCGDFATIMSGIGDRWLD